MSKPILTIAIPAYNVELYIEETITSLIKSKYVDKIEVLIINDGSSDSTAEVSQSIANKYSCVKVINKKNGGHGSAINSGLEHATGKYFRLLDGDDWFDTKEFDKYIEKLRSESADLVFTDYVECFTKANFNRLVTYYSNLPEYQSFQLDDIKFTEWGATLPTTTIKTKLLKDFNLKIDEHCFYVDQEYNLACYLCSQTAIYYPLAIYQYRLEREGQSMERGSLIKNVLSHEKVCTRLLSEYHKNLPSMSTARQEYLSNRVIIPMCHMQYTIACEYCKSSTYFRSFNRKLKKYPKFYNHPGVAGNIIHFHRKTKGLFVKFTNLINNLANYKNAKPVSHLKTFKFLSFSVCTIILILLIILIDHNTGLLSSKIPDSTWDTFTATTSSFHNGIVSGLSSFNANLLLNHNLLFLAPLIPFLLLFGTSKTILIAFSFIIYILIPSLLFTSIIKKTILRLKMNKLVKLSILFFIIILTVLIILSYFFSVNPILFLIASIILHFLLHTKLECIPHYFILSFLLSLLTFIDASLLPFTILFYILLFIGISLLSYKHIHSLHPFMSKTIKNLIKTVASLIIFFILFQIT